VESATGGPGPAGSVRRKRAKQVSSESVNCAAAC
jgi:hypothetical protein